MSTNEMIRMEDKEVVVVVKTVLVVDNTPTQHNTTLTDVMATTHLPTCHASLHASQCSVCVHQTLPPTEVSRPTTCKCTGNMVALESATDAINELFRQTQLGLHSSLRALFSVEVLQTTLKTLGGLTQLCRKFNSTENMSKCQSLSLSLTRQFRPSGCSSAGVN